jgi:hypothetical protein
MVTSLTSLSSEVLLRILDSFDNARDLLRFRQVSRRMYNIGGDALVSCDCLRHDIRFLTTLHQLWRNLFIHTYLRPSLNNNLEQRPQAKRRRLSCSADTAADRDSTAPSRVIKGLPMLQELTSSLANGTEESDRRVDWYTLFKVSRNWQRGNFSSRQLQTLQGIGHDAIAVNSKLVSSKSCEIEEQAHTHPRTLIDSTSSHIFASLLSHSQQVDSSPALLVFPSDSREDICSGEESQEPLARFQSSYLSTHSLKRVCISSLAVDKGQLQGASVRLFVGYSNGASSLLYFDTATNTFHDEIELDKDNDESIVSAALHCAMLVTCTLDFRIRLYRASQHSLRMIEERRSYCCHWPASLRLEPLIGKDEDAHYRLSIAYSSPVYPIGWTVGLQEIIVGTQASIQSRSASARRSHVVTCLDSPRKEEKKKTLFKLEHSTVQRRNQVGRLTSLSYEDPFIVVGTKDNNVVCFKVVASTRMETNAREPIGPLELNHVCTFQGHTGTVHSVSLNEGRCVTGGSDGSVRVWRLGDEEAAIAKAAGLLTTIDASLRKGLGKVVTIGAAFKSGKRKRETREALSATPLSLSDILRESRSSSSTTNNSSTTSAAVRLVASAFDHIISVSSVKTSSNPTNGNISCRAESSVEREEEQIQIWNFAR